MKKFLTIIAILLSGCVTSTSPYLDIGGVKMRKTAAFSAPLFTIGIIDNGGRNRFVPKGTIILNDFPIEVRTIYYSEETATASLEAEGKWNPGVADISVDMEHSKEKRLKGKYVVFRNIENYSLIDKLNDPVNTEKLKRLKEENKPVIITGMAIVSDNEVYKKADFNSGLQASFTSASSSPIVNLKGSSGLEIKAGFSNGTIFAYEYSRIEWDTSSAMPKIKNLNVDKPSLW